MSFLYWFWKENQNQFSEISSVGQISSDRCHVLIISFISCAAFFIRINSVQLITEYLLYYNPIPKTCQQEIVSKNSLDIGNAWPDPDIDVYRYFCHSNVMSLTGWPNWTAFSSTLPRSACVIRAMQILLGFSMFLIQRFACPWGSIMRGQRRAVLID